MKYTQRDTTLQVTIMSWCSHCLISAACETTPLAHLHRVYFGEHFFIYVHDLTEALEQRFLSQQLILCRCCRTLFCSADRQRFFYAIFVKH